MRTLTAACILGITIAAMPFHGAAAEDEVLLPQDSQTTHAPDQQPTGDNLPYTPAPTQTPTQPQATVAPLPQLPVNSQIPPANPQASPAYPTSIPTKIIKIPTISGPPVSSGANSIGISLIQGKWVPAQTSQVSQKLGISKDKVAALCHISAGGALVTDKSPAPFDMVDSQSVTAHYDGRLTSLMVATRALCDGSVTVPPNSGMIMQYGDKYVVILGGGSCAVPAGVVPTQAVVGSSDNGSTQCTFK